MDSRNGAFDDGASSRYESYKVRTLYTVRRAASATQGLEEGFFSERLSHLDHRVKVQTTHAIMQSLLRNPQKLLALFQQFVLKFSKTD